MQRGFTKLFNTIVTSTIWQEDDKTRIVWITMLAIADAFGNVFAAIPGLASVANVGIEAAEKAIANLMEPDAYSRTKDFEGRRIEVIDGGWHILNYDKYRKLMSEEERREYKAKWARESRRQKRTNIDKNGQSGTESGRSGHRQKQRAEGEGEAIPQHLTDVVTYGTQIGLDSKDSEAFFDFYTSNGWRVGRNPMKSWRGALRNWKRNKPRYGTDQKRNAQNSRSDGTLNEGKASQYRGVGKVVQVPDVQ